MPPFCSHRPPQVVWHGSGILLSTSPVEDFSGKESNKHSSPGGGGGQPLHSKAVLSIVFVQVFSQA
jgi:hypothetical protein